MKLVFALALGGFFVDTEVFAADSLPMQMLQYWSLQQQALDRAKGVYGNVHYNFANSIIR